MPKIGYSVITINDDLMLKIDRLVDINNLRLKTRSKVIESGISLLKKGETK